MAKQIGLGFRRGRDESYREAVERIAGDFGLEDEALETFDDYVSEGYSEADAAWTTLHDWDVLTFHENGVES